MSNPNNLIPFALDHNNVLRTVDQVAKGAKCLCYCPACGEPLIARKGNERIHHFSHAVERNCETAFETGLHLAAKQIFLEMKSLYLPACHVFGTIQNEGLVKYSFKEFPISPTHQNIKVFNESNPRSGFASISEKVVSFTDVELEKSVCDIRPDAIGYIKDKRIFVEFAVTHFVDEEKIEKIFKLKTATIEVSLTHLIGKEISFDTIRHTLVGQVQHKKWLYNPQAITLCNRSIEEQEMRFETYSPKLDAFQYTDQSETNEDNGLSPVMRALKAARASALNAKQRNVETENQEQLPSSTISPDASRTAVLYYSHVDEYMTMPGATLAQWDAIDQYQRSDRKLHRNPLYFVDFDPDVYHHWRSNLTDSANLRQTWADLNIELGWAV